MYTRWIAYIPDAYLLTKSLLFQEVTFVERLAQHYIVGIFTGKTYSIPP